MNSALSAINNGNLPRNRTREVYVGSLKIGGGAPVVVQSMCTTDTRDVQATLRQIYQLAEADCELVRLAVLDDKAAGALNEIVSHAPVPIVADIHFNYKLALLAIKAGVHKLRLNPGNIGGSEKVREVVKAAREHKIPIRIGANSGSLPKDVIEKYGQPTPEGIVEAALRHIAILEEMDFHDIVVSLKSSEVRITVDAYRLMSETAPQYPLHIGITESGTLWAGTIKSSVGLGILLADGIGDTMRISLAADPVEEVKVAYEILKDLEIRQHGVTLIACPTCGRCEIDFMPLVQKVEIELRKIKEPIRVSVMGCVVNGPGESRQADVGVSAGRGVGLIMRKDKVIRKVKEKEIFEALMEEVYKVLAERKVLSATPDSQS